jgi:hypothetical protein
MSAMLESMKSDISRSFGGSISQELGNILDVFSSNLETLANKFAVMKQRIDYLE